jgi:hypothetical protein
MAKNKSKKSSFKFEWSWKTVGIISLIVNGAILLSSIFLVVFFSDGTMHFNIGMNRICSENFRNTIVMDPGTSDIGVRKALSEIDYMCRNHNSDTYYLEGLEKYQSSLGL